MRRFGFQWHITDRCNLRCLHCYQDAYSDENEQGIDTLKRFADKIFGSSKVGRVSVNITGGEPLLYPHISELLTHIEGFDTCEEISIITNGTFISQNLIESIFSLKKIRYIKISIESADPLVNDRIRGRKNLKSVTENLARFKMTGKEILIMMTLASYNFRGVADMVRYVRENGLAGLIFERFVPLGRGTGLRTEYLKRYEWKSAVSKILNVAGLDLISEDVVQYRAFWLVNERGRLFIKGALCNLGRGSMALMPDGSIFPCRRYPKKIADLKYEDLGSIMRKLSDYDRSRIKDRLSGEGCALCGFAECTGCRALTYAITHKENGDDLQCYL